MVDVVLLFGRIVLLALLYLFLVATVRTGIEAVAPGRPRGRSGDGVLTLRVEAGPKEIDGLTVPVLGPLLIGRSPDADLVIADDFVSAIHARVTPTTTGAIIEDLGSTNGTRVGGRVVTEPVPLEPGDMIELGPIRLEVVRT